jgi:hypothetical protein
LEWSVRRRVVPGHRGFSFLCRYREWNVTRLRGVIGKQAPVGAICKLHGYIVKAGIIDLIKPCIMSRPTSFVTARVIMEITGRIIFWYQEIKLMSRTSQIGRATILSVHRWSAIISACSADGGGIHCSMWR